MKRNYSLKDKFRRYAIVEQSFLLSSVIALIAVSVLTAIWQRNILNNAIDSYTEEEAKSLARILIYDLNSNPRLSKIAYYEEQLSLLSKEKIKGEKRFPLGLKSIVRRNIDLPDLRVALIASESGYQIGENEIKEVKKVVIEEELEKECSFLSQELTTRVTFSDHLRGVSINSIWGFSKIEAKEETLLEDVHSKKDLISVIFPLFLEMRRFGTVEVLVDRGSLKGVQKKVVLTLGKIQLGIFIFLFALLGIYFYMWYRFFRKIETKVVLPITNLSARMEKWEEETSKPSFEKDEIKRLYEAFDGLLKRFEEQKEQLIRAEKLGLMERVGAGLSHELNNALNPIKLRLDSLLLVGESPTLQDVKIIKEHLESAEKIIKDLNALRFKRGLDTKEKIKPKDWIDVVKRLFEPQLSKKTKVIYNYDENEPQMMTNRDILVEIALNLLLNAKDATVEEESPLIEFSFHKEEDLAVLEVKDNGKGFSREYLNNLYEPFFTTKAQGMGLGLFIVENYSKKLGGVVEIGNREEKGAFVQIKFKISEEKNG